MKPTIIDCVAEAKSTSDKTIPPTPECTTSISISTVDNLSNIAVNAQASLSKIEDANFAQETSNLTKAQILQQASTAMLAQANKGKSGMLQLIQGL